MLHGICTAAQIDQLAKFFVKQNGQEGTEGKYRIPSARATWRDYSADGAYFVTICTKNRTPYFGKVIDESVHLSEIGISTKICWEAIPEHFPFVALDTFVVMSNHLHGILIMDKGCAKENVVDRVETLHGVYIAALSEKNYIYIHMKRIALVCILGFMAMVSSGQEWPSEDFIVKYNYQAVVGSFSEDSPKKTDDLTLPMYPNGTQGIISLIKKETRYPNTKKAPKNGGKVLLEYVIEKDGYISNVKVLESAGKPFDVEAIRVLKKMERWIPGRADGKDVRVSFTQPIRFFVK